MNMTQILWCHASPVKYAGISHNQQDKLSEFQNMTAEHKHACTRKTFIWNATFLQYRKFKQSQNFPIQKQQTLLFHIVTVCFLAFAVIMADEVVYHHAPKTEDHCESATVVKTEHEDAEKSDRGLFDCFGKKEENKKCEEAEIASECKDEKNESLLEKLHISNSSSSSSSDEECEDGEKKIKKKKKDKGLKEKVEKKIEEYKEKKEEKKIEEHKGDTCEEVVVPPPSHHHTPPPPCEVVVHPPEPSCEPEEKKGFIEKIKDKLPGGHKKAEDESAAPPPPPQVVAHADDYVDAENETKDKKGIFEKIKEKLPGYHSKSEEAKKEKECD